MAVSNTYRIKDIPFGSSIISDQSPFGGPLTEQEESKLHSYFKNRAKRFQIVATTITPLGHLLDWIQPEAQTGGAKIANPPPRLTRNNVGQDKESQEFLIFELENSESERGPDGTVPILRCGLSDLRFIQILNDFQTHQTRRISEVWMSRQHDGNTLSNGEVYGGNFMVQNIQACGGQIVLHVTDSDTNIHQFEIGQICLISKSKAGLQSVEAGLFEQLAENGGKVVRLITSFSTQGYASVGDNQGGYNQSETGWVQVSNKIYPGALSILVCSHCQKSLASQIQYQLYEGNWWLAVNRNWIGYYPGRLFNSDGLRKKADLVALFGKSISDGNLQHSVLLE